MRTLRHVLWIGGPPGGGKSTVATWIARRHGLRRYSADTRTWRHRDRALRAGTEAARRWEAMTPERRWAGSTPHELLEGSLHRERGPMVVDDLGALAEGPRAETLSERRSLLREMNQATATRSASCHRGPSWRRATAEPAAYQSTEMCTWSSWRRVGLQLQGSEGWR